MKRKNMFLAVVGLLACAFFVQQAKAVPINGTIDFSGPLMTSVDSGTDWLMVFDSGSSATTTGATGDYSSVPNGTAATFTNFQFNKDTLAITSPAAPFIVWTFTYLGNTYDFLLDSPLSPGSTASSESPNHDYSIHINGTGTARITGFTDTPGTFTLDATGYGTRLTFTSSSSAVAVPDSGFTGVLLGLALAGVATMRRSIRSGESRA
jgi:VPDSG-CTERM motif